MNNLELECLPQWRFCSIPRGKKNPVKKDWQLNPKKLEEISSNENIGVILGEVSGGLLAIDFDGPSAFDYWLKHIGIPFESFDTVTWSSGRPGRCQMAFTVPREVWEYMPSKFAEPTADGEQIEWRWARSGVGCQSVVPPSIHPDTGKPYEWLRSPGSVSVAAMPAKLLSWALDHVDNKNLVKYTEVAYNEPKITDVTDDDYNKITELLELIKQRHHSLDYDTWIKVSWAVAAVLGRQIGEETMKQYWPEQTKNEYNRLYRGYNAQRSPKIGTLVHLAGLKPQDPVEKLRKKLQKYY